MPLLLLLQLLAGWPFWWRCWPWWWERDILHVVEQVEQALAGGGRFRTQQPVLSLERPELSSLARGRGFAPGMGELEELQPDTLRTQLVRRKLASPAIRELFPWWWWCSDGPSICFSATQGAVTVLDEDPATQTRWDLPSGSSVTLVGNSQAAGVCGGGSGPAHGFVFTRVGLTDVGDIHDGYADGAPGSPESDLAFAGDLQVFGEFSSSSGVAFYQVRAGQWSGNPARGGSAPTSESPLGVPLYNRALILRADNSWVPPFPVKMGPFSAGGHGNLYATQEARVGLAPGTLTPDIPVLNPGDELFWIDSGLKLDTAAQNLIGGAAEGGVTLSVRGFDAGFNPVALPGNPDDHLTLEVDTTPISVAHIDAFSAHTSGGATVLSTGDGDCKAFDVGPGGSVELDVTVRDDNGHLALYVLEADFAHGVSDPAHVSPGERSYADPPASFPGGAYQAPDQGQRAFVGGSEPITYHPQETCCYDFRLVVAKRVTNGYGSPGAYTADFWTASLKVD